MVQLRTSHSIMEGSRHMRRQMCKANRKSVKAGNQRENKQILEQVQNWIETRHRVATRSGIPSGGLWPKTSKHKALILGVANLEEENKMLKASIATAKVAKKIQGPTDAMYVPILHNFLDLWQQYTTNFQYNGYILS
jgi:hypothetical protein